ncbi:esterase [Mycolicibacterium sp. 120270]|uniref:esterase n=1 Tax=Mycolicibacterium sp. 120270 TaxID=3090600 RepID=UPI00299D1145|nr:esterase [Mycolicibacterium sp. 120270]MDX1884879.1 RsiV family protein [Mycolicibacterium sp. 120270]
MRLSTSILAVTTAVLVGFSSLAAMPAAAAPPKCSDLKGVLVGQNCVIEEADAGYSLKITYPAGYPDVQAVFDWVKQTRDGFVNVAKGPDARTMPYQLEVTPTEYNSAVPPRGTQSVVFKVYQDVGGTKPQTFFKAFNWDQGLRWPIVLDTGSREKTQPLFQPGTNPWPIIFPLVEAELEKQIGTKPAIAPAVGLNPTTYQNFAIQNDNLVFFFDEGAVLPESAGALAVSIPRGPVDRMIA